MCIRDSVTAKQGLTTNDAETDLRACMYLNVGEERSLIIKAKLSEVVCDPREDSFLVVGRSVYRKYNWSKMTKENWASKICTEEGATEFWSESAPGHYLKSDYMILVLIVNDCLKFSHAIPILCHELWPNLVFSFDTTYCNRANLNDSSEIPRNCWYSWKSFLIFLFRILGALFLN